MDDPSDDPAALAEELQSLPTTELADRIRRLGPLERLRLRRLVHPETPAPASKPWTSAQADHTTPLDVDSSPWRSEARRLRMINHLAHWAVYLLIAAGTVAVVFTAGSGWETGPRIRHSQQLNAPDGLLLNPSERPRLAQKRTPNLAPLYPSSADRWGATSSVSPSEHEA